MSRKDPSRGHASRKDPSGGHASCKDLVLDVRGRRCPLPVIELARRISDVSVDGVVVVLSDDPAARLDIPEWCRMRGHDYLGEAPDGERGPASDNAAPPAGRPPGRAATAYRVRRCS